LLLAGGLLSLKKNAYRVLLVFVFTVNLVTSFAYLLMPRFWREDWRSLVGFVEDKKAVNSITIFVSDSNMEAYRYYSPDAKIAGPVGISAGYNQIWLMTYVRDVFDKEDNTRKAVENLGYIKLGEYDFRGTGPVILYQASATFAYKDK
jgi:hypothetical protein